MNQPPDAQIVRAVAAPARTGEQGRDQVVPIAHGSHGVIQVGHDEICAHRRCAGAPHHAQDGKIAGGHARIGNGGHVVSQGWQPLLTTVCGQSVHEPVGSTVVGLPRIAEGG